MNAAQSHRSRGFSFAIPALMDGCIGLVQTAIPLLALRFGANALFLGTMGSMAQGARLPVCMTTGMLSEKIGRTRVIIPAAAMASVACLGLSISRNNLQVLALYVVFMISVGAFYPSFQAFIGDRSPRGELRKNLSAFNVGWTVGGAAFTLMAGYMFATSEAWPFVAAALLATGSIYVVRAWSRIPVDPSYSDQQEPITAASVMGDVERPRALLQIARSAHFTGFFGYSAIRSLFPKLGYSIGYSDGTIGLLLGVMLIGQAAGIFVTSAGPWWRGRLWPLVMALVMGVVSGIGIVFAESRMMFAAAFLLQGTSLGIAYTQALYYGLQSRMKMGRNTGIHESLVAAGNISGAFVGGVVAQYISLRTPYSALAALSGAVLVVVGLYWKFGRRQLNAGSGDRGG